MSFTSIGYDGTVTESGFALLAQYVGVPYCVGDYLDCQVTIGGAGVLPVQVRQGSAFGVGIYDTISGTAGIAATLNAGLVGSGTRWDTVVIHRDWSTNTSSFRINAGGAAKQVTQTDHTPGTLDDQPIALIRCISGSSTVQEIVDLRSFPSKTHHIASGASAPFMGYMRAGASFRGNDNEHEYVVEGTQTGVGTFTAAVKDLDAGLWQAFALAGGGALENFDTLPVFSVNRGRVQMRGSVQRVNGNGLTTATSGDCVLGTLPPGCRPASIRRFAAVCFGSDTFFNRLKVGADGTVTLYGDGFTTKAVSLDNISFIAEQ